MVEYSYGVKKLGQVGLSSCSWDYLKVVQIEAYKRY